jgi:hypothetical protein
MYKALIRIDFPKGKKQENAHFSSTSVTSFCVRNTEAKSGETI